MTDKPATNDELIAQIAAYSDDGTHRTGLLIKAAQALAAQDARIAELEAEVQSLEDAYQYDRERNERY